MNTIDIILIILLGFGAVSGFRKGLVMEVISVLAFILAIVGSFKLLHWGIDVLQEQLNISGRILPYLSFLLIFICIVFLVNLLGKVLKKVLDMTFFGGFDNFLGAGLGVIKWTFGLSALIWIFTYFDINPLDSRIDDSFLYPFVANFAPAVVDYLAVVLPFAENLFSSVRAV